MGGIAFWFIFTSSIYALAGMAWGIEMSATNNHSMAAAHAHLNLLGWVTMALFGIYYHLVPKAAEGILARIHFAVATVGLFLIIPGIVMVLEGAGNLPAKIGSLLTALSMGIFIVTVFRNRTATGGAASRPGEHHNA